MRGLRGTSAPRERARPARRRSRARARRRSSSARGRESERGREERTSERARARARRGALALTSNASCSCSASRRARPSAGARARAARSRGSRRRWSRRRARSRRRRRPRRRRRAVERGAGRAEREVAQRSRGSMPARHACVRSCAKSVACDGASTNEPGQAARRASRAPTRAGWAPPERGAEGRRRRGGGARGRARVTRRASARRRGAVGSTRPLRVGGDVVLARRRRRGRRRRPRVLERGQHAEQAAQPQHGLAADAGRARLAAPRAPTSRRGTGLAPHDGAHAAGARSSDDEHGATRTLSFSGSDSNTNSTISAQHRLHGVQAVVFDGLIIEGVDRKAQHARRRFHRPPVPVRRRRTCLQAQAVAARAAAQGASTRTSALFWMSRASERWTSASFAAAPSRPRR